MSDLFKGQDTLGSQLFEGKPRIADELFVGEPSMFPQGQPPRPDGNGFVIQTDRPIFEGNGAQKQPAGFALPHVYTEASLYNIASKTYSWRWDEAYRRCRQDALAMRRDAFIMALLKERIYPTAQMSWHLEPDDKKDPFQMQVCDYLKTCIDSLPNVSQMLTFCLEALWYGRAAVQIAWAWKEIADWTGAKRRSLVPENVIPVNGDKLELEWDLQTWQVRLYAGAERDCPPEDIAQTDRGTMLRLHRPYWRDRFIVHSHDVVDADWYETSMAGQIGGIGIRSWCYWTWWLRQEISSYLIDFMQRTGTGFTVYYFDPGNPADQAAAIKIAKQQGNATWIVWPRSPADTGAQKGVERIEPSTSGATVLKDILGHYDSYLERFIVGQSMSSGDDNDGSLGGSGKANFAKQTKQYIIRNDCLQLAGTLSRDLVAKLLKFNVPEATFGVRWKFDVDVDDPQAKLEAAKQLFDMGVTMKADEIRGAAGFAKPEGDDETVGGQAMAAMGQPGANPGAPPGQKEPGAFEGNPPANGTPVASAGNLSKDESHKTPVRYAKGKAVDLTLYAYKPEGDPEAIPIGHHEEWEGFAEWASDKGGELSRLAVEGHTDGFRPKDALMALDGELMRADVPEQYKALAEQIRDAARLPGVEGLVISGDQDDGD